MGRLIVLEGIDGSGKSTQFRLLCDHLADDGVAFKRLTFPRYDKPSSALLKMYLGGEFGDDPDAVNAYAASAFFAVDRIASFIQDWREYYEDGGLLLTDRYTTSNAIHHGAKLKPAQREQFFKWLYDFEFDRLGLPAPDYVVFLNIEAEQAARRLRRREDETGTSADIHEKDASYLKHCVQIGKQAATLYGWLTVDCMRDGLELDENELHADIWRLLRNNGVFG